MMANLLQMAQNARTAPPPPPPCQEDALRRFMMTQPPIFSMLFSRWMQMIGSKPLRVSWKLLTVKDVTESFMLLTNYKARPRTGRLLTLLLMEIPRLSLCSNFAAVSVLTMFQLVKSRAYICCTCMFLKI